LFQDGGIPRKIEMDDIATLSMKINAFLPY
jgi:hypothetical protein